MLPGMAAMRSATSDCTITVAEESSGNSWKKRRTTVAATAYGRFATSAKGGPIGRLQITVKTEGSYTDLRRFLRELPAALPALALSRLSTSRQKPSDTALETNVEFALFYARAET